MVLIVPIVELGIRIKNVNKGDASYTPLIFDTLEVYDKIFPDQYKGKLMAKTRTSFKKGEIHNPNGRPLKGYSITEWFQNMLNSDPATKEKLARAILGKALEGDSTAQKTIWQYMDGMPKQDMDIKSDGQQINKMEIIITEAKGLNEE